MFDLSGAAALHPSHDPDRKLIILELNHGKANEMGVAQLDAFEALCEGIEADPVVMCLCTTSRRYSSRGKPLFIAGANVTERGDWDDDRVRAHVHRQRALMGRIRRLPVFHIALSHGVTLGWGVEYLLTADYTLATSTATFGLPETGLGIVPGARGSAELADLIGPSQALRLGCTGEVIDAVEATRIGLAQELVSTLDAGMARALVLAEALARRSPTAVAAFKRAVLASRGESERVRLAHEAQAYEQAVACGDAALGRQNFAGIVAGQSPTWGPRRSPASPA